jgi:hypothetical protein
MFHVGIVCVLKDKCVPYHAIKAYERVVAYLHSFLASPLGIVSGQFYAATALLPFTQSVGRWIGLRAVLENLGVEKYLLPCRESNYDSSDV